MAYIPISPGLEPPIQAVGQSLRDDWGFVKEMPGLCMEAWENDFRNRNFLGQQCPFNFGYRPGWDSVPAE